MKKILLLVLLPLISWGQATIKGKITDKKGAVLPGANIQIEGLYDGASANEKGEYSFKTDEIGDKTLSVSMLGYKPSNKKIKIEKGEIQQDFVLEESINTLNAVVITAGTFEASDEKKMVMLKPLDIVTTAGGGADITAVMHDATVSVGPVHHGRDGQTPGIGGLKDQVGGRLKRRH